MQTAFPAAKPYWSNHQKLAALRLFFALLSFVLVTGLSAGAAISSLFALAWRLQAISLVVALAGALFVLPLYRFISKEPLPGAGDNLVSCALSVNMFARFCARAKDGHPLQHTKLACLSTNGEECGQRGSAFYAMAHAEELHAVETAVINLDSLFNLCDLAILNRDRHGCLKLSDKLSRDVVQVANELGYPLPIKGIPFGGGGTDAASFAKTGIEAVSIVAMPTSLFQGEHWYHTPYDTVDHIEPAAVQAVFDIVCGFIERFDRAVATGKDF